MNTYLQRFTALCPNNGQPIHYAFKLETRRTVMVEDIQTAVGRFREGYHEEFADQLRFLGGQQTLTATHHGTEIITVRQANWLCKLRHSWRVVFPEDGNCYTNVFNCKRCGATRYEGCYP